MQAAARDRRISKDLLIALSPAGAPVLYVAYEWAGRCTMNGGLDTLACGNDPASQYIAAIGSLVHVGAFLFGASLLWIGYAAWTWIRLGRTVLFAATKRLARKPDRSDGESGGGGEQR